ncbi:MAG: insulinase family protein [Labilithrix sp.]|nr:insulinase family protein [Labilithrix sp.]MCW5814371.1 insulinase family protein [Labilithrix sp.]
MTAHQPVRFDLDGGGVGFVESSAAVPLVSIVVSVRSGAIADPAGKDGVCRFAARMLRRGAGGRSAQEIEASIDRLGAELSLDVGPSTVSFHGQVIRRNVDKFVDLLTSLLGQPTFDPAEVARLKRETSAEIVEARDSDRALANLAFRRALFPGHPYARSAAGRLPTIDAIGRDDVVAAYDRHFVRRDLVLGFAGAISVDEAKVIAARITSAVKEGPPLPMKPPEPTAPTGRRLVFVDKPERTQTQTLIGSLGTWPHDEDHVPLVTATAVLGGTFTSRMMREIRSKRGWSYGTSARLSIERRRHAFTMAAAPAAADCAPCTELMLELLEDFVAKGISKRELGFIKNYLVRSYAFEIDTAPKRLGQAIETELLELPADYHTRYVDHVKDVTLERANAAAKMRLDPQNLVVIVVGTAADTLEAVKAKIPGLTATDVVPFDAD